MAADLGASSSSTIIREVWIEKEMQKRAKEFTENKKLTVYVGTWNVNAKKPSEDLEDWLLLPGYETADIYAIGFQEIVDLNAGNLLVDHNASKPWEDKIERTLKQQYVQVATKHLVGLSLCVYVKRALRQEVSEISAETVGVGIMGVGGNKGAVGIRFNLFNSSLCFVNSHLAAHQHNSAGRNADYAAICARLLFNDAKSKIQKGAKATLFEHDHLFWLGDLNYRISISDILEVYRRIEVGDWPGLLAHDQLLIEKAKGNAFKHFKEGVIHWPPTYKYQPGTNLYERREDKKKRAPAWCDRVQWIGDDITQLCYLRCETLKISDHKPVSALFEIGAQQVVQDKKRLVYDSLIRQLDSWENQAIPKVEIRPPQIELGAVRFDEPVRRTLTIENIGAVTVVEFHFVPKLATGLDHAASAAGVRSGLQSGQCGKSWLRITPEMGIIPPGESLDIVLEACITSSCAHAVQTGAEPLEDILILALENGRDYFIPVQGNYVKSCFGSTIEYLVNTPSPVRDSVPTRDASQVLSLPKEIWRMVDFLYRESRLREESLFVSSGEKEEVDRIRDDLDTGKEFDQGYSVHSMAECLIYFLNSLAEPIFPSSVVSQYVEGANLGQYCKQALLLLPPAHYNAFIYLVAFLRECLKHADSNKLTPAQLVLVFAQCIMHCTVDAPVEEQSQQSAPAAAAAGAARPNGAVPAAGAPSSAASSSNAAQAGEGPKPKAWVILMHYLTSEEFI